MRICLVFYYVKGMFFSLWKKLLGWKMLLYIHIQYTEIYKLVLQATFSTLHSLTFVFCYSDCSGLVCQNGGTIDKDACSCTCPSYSFYVGNRCDRTYTSKIYIFCHFKVFSRFVIMKSLIFKSGKVIVWENYKSVLDKVMIGRHLLFFQLLAYFVDPNLNIS